MLKHCEPCQRTRSMPSLAPLHSWEFTKRLHVDYAGPVNGKMLFIIVDSHTKWVESFSTHGIPDTIVSDNATCFISSEFQGFCKHSGIRHIIYAPHHPSSNGLAESQVWTQTYG